MFAQLTVAINKLADVVKGFLSEQGQLSHTKLWSSVAYATGSWVIINQTLAHSLNTECFIAYLTICAAHSGYSKFISTTNPPAKDQA